MNNVVTTFVEVPEDLHNAITAYVEAHRGADQNAVYIAALSQWLMRRDQPSEKQIIEELAA